MRKRLTVPAKVRGGFWRRGHLSWVLLDEQKFTREEKKTIPDIQPKTS